MPLLTYVKPLPPVPNSAAPITVPSVPVDPLAKQQQVMGDDVILGFVKNGVITQRGVLRPEEHLTVDGKKDFVKNVDVMRGILYLGSGKKVQK